MPISFDDNGKVKVPTSEALREADETMDIITYVAGTAFDGRPYYAFVAVKPSRYAEYYVKTAELQQMNPADYGTIVASGFEPEPPEDIIAFMKRNYGYDPDFETKFREVVLSDQKASPQVNQDQRIADFLKKFGKPEGQ